MKIAYNCWSNNNIKIKRQKYKNKQTKLWLLVMTKFGWKRQRRSYWSFCFSTNWKCAHNVSQINVGYILLQTQSHISQTRNCFATRTRPVRFANNLIKNSGWLMFCLVLAWIFFNAEFSSFRSGWATICPTHTAKHIDMACVLWRPLCKQTSLFGKIKLMCRWVCQTCATPRTQTKKHRNPSDW